jgi:hypothetical protein
VRFLRQSTMTIGASEPRGASFWSRPGCVIRKRRRHAWHEDRIFRLEVGRVARLTPGMVSLLFDSGYSLAIVGSLSDWQS